MKSYMVVWLPYQLPELQMIKEDILKERSYLSDMPSKNGLPQNKKIEK